VVTLPAWDGMHSGRMIGVILGLVLAVAGAVVFITSGLRGRWATIGAAGAFIVLYSSISGSIMIMERSRLVSRLPDCEAGGSTASAAELAEKAEGPHLKDGTPCVQHSENRTEFRRRYPTGELLDGFRQMFLRYPGDLVRIMMVPMVALFLIATAGILFAKAMGPLLMAQRNLT
jgi:hypothetical protein